MTPAALLSQLATHGVRVAMRDAGPVLVGAGRSGVPEGLMRQLKAQREAVILEVETQAAFDRLAAILEKGGVPYTPEGDDVQTGTLPPSWCGNREPLPGDTCFCCYGGNWWRRSNDSPGWVCWNCHPAHEEAGLIRKRW